MMGWRCIVLLSIECTAALEGIGTMRLLLGAAASAAAPTNATYGALADRVIWARANNTASYTWPNGRLRHFTPVEAFDLLRGRHVLVLGNSVARHVVIALHWLIRGRAPDAHRIRIGSHALPALESSVWDKHGAASAELTPQQKYVTDACRHANENMDVAAATVNCCVARRKASNYSFILTYAFTATPSEPQIRRRLGLWAGRANCASSLAPDYVVLCLTQTDVVAFRALARQCAALRKLHPRTNFVLVTPPHVKRATGLMLRAFDLAAVAEAKPFDGVVALPVGESTARGVSEGVLKRDADDSHNFADAGRLFELEMLLNAFSIASAAEPDRIARPKLASAAERPAGQNTTEKQIPNLPRLAVGSQASGAACAPRYINVGMPKTGSTSIEKFFQCHNMSAGHWYVDAVDRSESHLIGDQTHACDVRGRPLLDCGPCFDVHAQIDEVNPPFHCFLPQITHLAGLFLDYGNATFLLPTRDARAWASSVQRWYGMGRRFTRCQLPSVGAPRNTSTAALAQFYRTVTGRARAMLTRAEQSHGLRWVEFDITDPSAAEILAGTVPGSGRPACWGSNNVNTKLHPSGVN